MQHQLNALPRAEEKEIPQQGPSIYGGRGIVVQHSPDSHCSLRRASANMCAPIGCICLHHCLQPTVQRTDTSSVDPA